MSDRGELQSIVVASSTSSESSRTLRRDFKGISVALNGEPRFTLGRSYRTHTPDSSVAYMCLPLHRSTNNTHTHTQTSSLHVPDHTRTNSRGLSVVFHVSFAQPSDPVRQFYLHAINHIFHVYRPTFRMHHPITLIIPERVLNQCLHAEPFAVLSTANCSVPARKKIISKRIIY